MAKTVLVVDDDPTQRRLMQAAAEKQGFRARVVENGERALEEAGDHKNGVDVVLLDLVMPGLSGMDTLERLIERRPDLPVIVITATGGIDTVVQAMRAGHGIHSRNIPGTYRPVQNRDNDYLMDRAAQKAGTEYSGIRGIAIQDSSLQESMGPICDRTKENLVGTDNGIIMARQRLMKAARALAEKGELPPGRDPAHQRIRSAAVLLPRGVPFKDAARDALLAEPGKKHASV